MAGGKNNTQRIETLEIRVESLSTRLEVHGIQIDRLDELLKKCSDASEGNGSKITIIEQHLFFVDLKGTMTIIASIKEDLVVVKKDIENLQSWKGEQKRKRGSDSTLVVFRPQYYRGPDWWFHNHRRCRVQRRPHLLLEQAEMIRWRER
jgi:hypothetical protein